YTAARNTGADVAGFARGLQQAGYATDPHYARKITDIAQRLVREGWVP
ncbi:MAG: glucosaminidase domain-containing protein, partial [Polycyclovorans sp.]